MKLKNIISLVTMLSIFGCSGTSSIDSFNATTISSTAQTNDCYDLNGWNFCRLDYDYQNGTGLPTGEASTDQSKVIMSSLESCQGVIASKTFLPDLANT